MLFLGGVDVTAGTVEQESCLLSGRRQDGVEGSGAKIDLQMAHVEFSPGRVVAASRAERRVVIENPLQRWKGEGLGGGFSLLGRTDARLGRCRIVRGRGRHDRLVGGLREGLGGSNKEEKQARCRDPHDDAKNHGLVPLRIALIV